MKEANLKKLHSTQFQLYDILEKTGVQRQSIGSYGLIENVRRILQGGITIPYGRIMVGTVHHRVVKTHRTLPHKSYSIKTVPSTVMIITVSISLFIWLYWVLAAACGIFSCGVWNLVPWQGAAPRPPAWECGVLTAGQPREIPLNAFKSQSHGGRRGISTWNAERNKTV